MAIADPTTNRTLPGLGESSQILQNNVQSYIAGFCDGTAFGNSRAAGAAPEAMLEFALAARSAAIPGINAIAFGLYHMDLAVVVVTEDIDVSSTRALFRIKDSVEQGWSTSFELIIRPAQGRLVADLVPRDFVFDS